MSGEPNLIFGGLGPLRDVLISTPLIYAMTVAMVRISGKRTTSQMNNFDWVVTVAMGSLVASGMVSKSTSVTTVAFAIALLLALQWIVTRSVLASRFVESAVKADPRLLVGDGRPIESAMRAERVAMSELLAAAREAGCRDLDDVAALVLETDGTFSVFAKADRSGELLAGDAFRNVTGREAALGDAVREERRDA